LGADLADQAKKRGFGHAPLYSSRPIVVAGGVGPPLHAIV
jgi:hypothetical protein